MCKRIKTTHTLCRHMSIHVTCSQEGTTINDFRRNSGCSGAMGEEPIVERSRCMHCMSLPGTGFTQAVREQIDIEEAERYWASIRTRPSPEERKAGTRESAKSGPYYMNNDEIRRAAMLSAENVLARYHMLLNVAYPNGIESVCGVTGPLSSEHTLPPTESPPICLPDQQLPSEMDTEECATPKQRDYSTILIGKEPSPNQQDSVLPCSDQSMATMIRGFQHFREDTVTDVPLYQHDSMNLLGQPFPYEQLRLSQREDDLPQPYLQESEMYLQACEGSSPLSCFRAHSHVPEVGSMSSLSRNAPGSKHEYMRLPRSRILPISRPSWTVPVPGTAVPFEKLPIPDQDTSVTSDLYIEDRSPVDSRDWTIREPKLPLPLPYSQSMPPPAISGQVNTERRLGAGEVLVSRRSSISKKHRRDSVSALSQRVQPGRKKVRPKK